MYLSILTFVLDAQKNCLNETVLLSTNNIMFSLSNNFFKKYTFLSRGLKNAYVIKFRDAYMLLNSGMFICY